MPVSDAQLEALVKAAGGSVAVRSEVSPAGLAGALGFVGKGYGRPGISAGIPGLTTKNLPRPITRRSVLISFASAPAAGVFVEKSGEILRDYINGRAQQEITITAGDVSVKLRGPHSVDEAQAAFRMAAETTKARR